MFLSLSHSLPLPLSQKNKNKKEKKNLVSKNKYKRDNVLHVHMLQNTKDTKTLKLSHEKAASCILSQPHTPSGRASVLQLLMWSSKRSLGLRASHTSIYVFFILWGFLAFYKNASKSLER